MDFLAKAFVKRKVNNVITEVTEDPVPKPTVTESLGTAYDQCKDWCSERYDDVKDWCTSPFCQLRGCLARKKQGSLYCSEHCCTYLQCKQQRRGEVGYCTHHYYREKRRERRERT